jgi:NADH:ubiquinone oxidoreductase subunit 6 (subunit J)
MVKALVTTRNIVFVALLLAIVGFFVTAAVFLLQGNFPEMFNNIYNMLASAVGAVFIATLLPNDY